MASPVPVTTPAGHITINFPLINQTVQVGFASALPKLSTALVLNLAACANGTPDDFAVAKLLAQWAKEPANEELRGAMDCYRAAYKQLNAKLLDHRGYGLDGDEEPTLKVGFIELLSWLESNHLAMSTEVLVDFVGSDLVLEKTGRRWHWSTNPEQCYVIPERLKGLKRMESFSSRMNAAADAVAGLGLRDLVRQNFLAQN